MLVGIRWEPLDKEKYPIRVNYLLEKMLFAERKTEWLEEATRTTHWELRSGRCSKWCWGSWYLPLSYINKCYTSRYINSWDVLCNAIEGLVNCAVQLIVQERRIIIYSKSSSVTCFWALKKEANEGAGDIQCGHLFQAGQTGERLHNKVGILPAGRYWRNNSQEGLLSRIT